MEAKAENVEIKALNNFVGQQDIFKLPTCFNGNMRKRLKIKLCINLKFTNIIWSTFEFV